MAKEEKMISCLSNETVSVKFIPKENAMAGNDPRHVLYGGMAESSTRTYVVPMLRSGQLKDVLTKDEKAFLEAYLGLEDNALSVYNIENNFWKKFKVTVKKDGETLKLSDGMDYIRYKVLLANSDLIAPSMQALEDHPKSTYEFVLVRENEALDADKNRIDARKLAYKVWGKLDSDADTLRVIIETIGRQPISSATTLGDLNVMVEKMIDKDPKHFLRVAEDEYLPTKVLIRNGIEAGVIVNRGGQLYMRDNNEPLCENGEPTLNVAAGYLNMPKNQNTKLLIEDKVKEYKNNLKK
jgi:hypothetical protein